jgi:L-iditol 2-dehydrogenase
MGFSFAGGMADYMVIPELAIKNGHVVKVPKNVAAEQASLAEPLSCAINACSNSNIKKDDIVVVLGAGPMGLMNVAVARAIGASKIILSEVNEDRLVQAKNFHIDILVNPLKDDLIEIVKSATNGIGADVVIVAAPATLPQETAIELVRKRGTVCLFASLPVGNEMLSMNSRLIHYGELNIVGSSDSTGEHVSNAINMISEGAIDAGKLVTHILDLEDIFIAFELMERGESLRVVLKP